MVPIICVDNHMGILFNNRRQSEDPALIDHLLNLCDGNKLIIGRQSISLFPRGANVVPLIGYLDEAGPTDLVFVEENISDRLSQVRQMVICKWNRDYPADVTLKVDPKEWHKVVLDEFEGDAHPKITIEGWKRKTGKKKRK